MFSIWTIILVTVPFMVFAFWRNYKDHPELIRAVFEFLACGVFCWLCYDPQGFIYSSLGKFSAVLISMVGITFAGGLGSLAGKYIKT